VAGCSETSTPPIFAPAKGVRLNDLPRRAELARTTATVPPSPDVRSGWRARDGMPVRDDRAFDRQADRCGNRPARSRV
jgi:hypothetical protein